MISEANDFDRFGRLCLYESNAGQNSTHDIVPEVPGPSRSSLTVCHALFGCCKLVALLMTGRLSMPRLEQRCRKKLAAFLERRMRCAKLQVPTLVPFITGCPSYQSRGSMRTCHDYSFLRE